MSKEDLERSEIMEEKYRKARKLFEETLTDVAHMNVRICGLSIALLNIVYEVSMGCSVCEKHTLIAEEALEKDDEYCERLS